MDSTSGRSPRFATTRWSLVQSVGSNDRSVADRALEELLDIYWYPLYAYARRRGRSVEAAQDSVQGFLLRLVDGDRVGLADPDRGRFRTFLLTAFRNFMVNEAERANAEKRGGGRPIVALDAMAAEARLALEPGHDQSPDRLFIRDWAVTLLRGVLAGVRRDYQARGQEDLFEQLKPCLAGGSLPGGLGSVAEALGMGEGAVRVALHRLRRRYRDALFDEVSQTLSDEEDTVETEVESLLDALSGEAGL